MAAGRRKKHGEKDNEERWLLTYADMITLLMALFMVLFSISSVNVSKYQVVAGVPEGRLLRIDSAGGQGADAIRGTGGAGEGGPGHGDPVDRRDQPDGQQSEHAVRAPAPAPARHKA